MQILAQEERQLTKEDAAEFYKQHEGSVRSNSLSYRLITTNLTLTFLFTGTL